MYINRYYCYSDGWHRINSFAFKYIDENVHAQTARQKCQHLSADLASVSNEQEQQFIQNTVLKGNNDDMDIYYDVMDTMTTRICMMM